MTARPLVSILKSNGKPSGKTVPLPAVLTAPIRPDVVNIVHTNMAKNHRQPYAVSLWTGHQTSAESWGTGRAVARIPRVSGGGTHRAGQGAFGNMCRGGRMFAPTKIWRRWHRHVNVTMKRNAIASALAASAVPSLVLARGHRISHVPEIPLVVDTKAMSGIKKTKGAVDFLKGVKAYADVEKVIRSKVRRAGKGKMRNRMYRMRRGPLVIYKDRSQMLWAFRNIPGVELQCVTRLNLLELAPGGHIGRFIIWTSDAFEMLDTLWGTGKAAAKMKKGYRLPHAKMTLPDIMRVLRSGSVTQSLARKAGPAQMKKKRIPRNPLKDVKVMAKFNPLVKQQWHQKHAMLPFIRRRNLWLQKVKHLKKLRAALQKKGAKHLPRIPGPPDEMPTPSPVKKARKEATKKAKAENKPAEPAKHVAVAWAPSGAKPQVMGNHTNAKLFRKTHREQLLKYGHFITEKSTQLKAKPKKVAKKKLTKEQKKEKKDKWIAGRKALRAAAAAKLVELKGKKPAKH
ncbi:60S ribosomal protein L4 [Pelomyxa schiedti]|nr:60S ribosomal protein L4 [Pelomyxa schiedti]